MEKINICDNIFNSIIKGDLEKAINIYNTYMHLCMPPDKHLINLGEARFNLCPCTKVTMLDAYLYKGCNDKQTIEWLIDQKINYTLRHTKKEKGSQCFRCDCFNDNKNNKIIPHLSDDLLIKLSTVATPESIIYINTKLPSIQTMEKLGNKLYIPVLMDDNEKLLKYTFMHYWTSEEQRLQFYYTMIDNIKLYNWVDTEDLRNFLLN